MECLAQEPVSFGDVLCQMADMLRPATPGRVTLADLRRCCRLAGQYFNVLFNLGKFAAHEGRDPVAIRAEREDPGASDWDRFARGEYNRLSLEEEAEGGGSGGGGGGGGGGGEGQEEEEEEGEGGGGGEGGMMQQGPPGGWGAEDGRD